MLTFLILIWLTLFVLCVLAAIPAQASGMTRVSAQGRSITVASSAAPKFRCLLSKLGDAGYPVLTLGGLASHGHIRGSKHYSGRAIDINQVRRNVVLRPLPARATAMAESCGLVHGAVWRNPDQGHFEVAGGGRLHGRHHPRRRHSRR